MRSNHLLSFLAPIRLRYLLVIAIILGLIFFSLTYLGIRKARQSLLKIMVDDGKALAAGLTLSSNNAIQAGILLESLSEDKFADLAQSAVDWLGGSDNPEWFRQFRDENSLLSLDFLSPDLTIVGSDRWAVGFVPQYPPEVAAAIHDLKSMGGNYRSVIVYDDSLQPQEQYFIYAPEPDSDLVVMSTEAIYMDQIAQRIGIGNLIRSISNQAGIEYIVLQGREGIILSSRAIPPIPSIDSDPFLDSVMTTDTTAWRRLVFEDKEVLEIARRFESVEYPPGVFRIGMDLDEYREISRGYDTQIITIAVVLFLLTIMIVAVVSINQNYFILNQSFTRMQSMTETIFDRLSSAVLAIDGDNKILALNPAFTDMSGIGPDAIGKTIDAVSGRIPFEIPDEIGADQRLVSSERDIIIPSGERITVLLGISPLPPGAGGGMVFLIHDITEQKRLERENRRRERLSEMGDMAAGVAHEIRNPLNSISIAAQRLKLEFEPTADSETYGTMTKNILDETTRLNNILTRFLELARSRGTGDKPVDICKAIGKAVETMRPEAQAQKVTIEFASPAAVSVIGDPDKFEQVFINLLKNSLQAMPGGGTVAIAVETGGGEVSITITDSGPGFPEADLPKIFQPYFTTKADGSGLGLALAYKTVADSDGEILASNIPGGGARVTIVLPQAK